MAGTVSRHLGGRDLFDWFDWPLPFTRRMFAIKVEDFVDDGRYVLRAELPGFDPAKDLTVTVGGGMLRIHAERHEEVKDARHSEFTYGEFDRTVALPDGADDSTVTARYDNGVLEISMKVTGVAPAPREVPITGG